MVDFDEHKAQKEEERKKEELSRLIKVLSEKREVDYSELLEKILSKEVSLGGVIEAIKSIPTPKEVDTASVVKAIKGIKIEEKTVKIPEQKPDTETHRLLSEMLGEFQKKAKKAQGDGADKNLVKVLKDLSEKIDEMSTGVGEMVGVGASAPDVVGIKGSDGNELVIKDDGSIDVNVQDQTTNVLIGYMSDEHASTTIAATGAINDLEIQVADATDFVAGDYLSIFSVPDNRVYLASILSVAGSTVNLDTPLDFAFPIGSFVTAGNRNMNVDGSVTPVVYGLRNTDEAIGTAFDITRLIFTMTTDAAVDLSKFGDIAGGLTRGVVMRKKDGVYANIFNVKTNGELANIMYDVTIESASNPAQGQNGLIGRLTFGGQSKIGVVVRLEPGEDIQLIVQDDLSDLLSFGIIAEGHAVE